jgi:uncharacterized repeat protein (TIGR01451 family)
VSFEPFVAVAPGSTGQSESQLRPMPDGSSAMVLWMGEQLPGDVNSKDAMHAVVTPFDMPDLRLSTQDVAFVAGGQSTLTVSVTNHGAGNARHVVVTGSVPDHVRLVGISDPSACSIRGSEFRCEVPELAAAQTRTVSVTVASNEEGSYTLLADASSDDLDEDVVDNASISRVLASAPVAEPPPGPGPAPLPGVDEGGGCTTANSSTPLDPTLPVLAVLGLIGLGLRRVFARRGWRDQRSSHA